MLHDILNTQRDKLLAAWIQTVRDTYPKAGRIRFAQRSEQFNDPLGHILDRDLPVLLEMLLNDFDSEALLHQHLEPLCRLRSVQEFSPSEAVGFVYSLKRVIRETLAAEQSRDKSDLTELLAIEARIDRLAMYAFDVYVSCREELFEIRSREAARRSELIVKHFSEHGKHAFDSKANLVGEKHPSVTNGNGGGNA